MRIILNGHYFLLFLLICFLSRAQAADSVYQASVDFNTNRGFSYTTSKNEKMTYNASVGAMKAESELYLFIGRDYSHPGLLADAILRFTSPAAGKLVITGKVYDYDSSCGGSGAGSGVVVTVKKNTTVLSQSTIANGDKTGINMNLSVSVAAGDKIDFVTNARGDWSCDMTHLDPKIVFTPNPTAPIPIPTPTPPTPNTFKATIKAEHSGKCFDTGTAATDKTKITQAPCNNLKNQNFIFTPKAGGLYEIKGELTGKCVDHLDSNTADGASVVQATCTGKANQLFRLENKGGEKNKIHSKVNDKCLDVSGISTADKAPIIVWTCLTGLNQNFFLKKITTTPTPIPPTPIPPTPVPPTPTPSAAWPNQPKNFKTLLDCGFDHPLCNGKLLDPYNAAGLAASPPSMHTISVARDSGAPLSPSNMYRSTMNYQLRQGGSQTHFFAPTAIKEVYVGLWWKSNPDFTGNTTGGNKMFFIRGAPGQNGVFMWQRPRGSNLSRFFWTTQLPYNLDRCGGGGGDIDQCFANKNDIAIVAGTWYRIEVYMKASSCATCKDGAVKWWVTPKGGKTVLAGDYPNFAYGPSVAEWVWSETWDGHGNGTGFATDPSHYIDHLHISAP